MLRPLILPVALASSVPAFAEDDYEWQQTLIHSDLPLYDFSWDDFWPRSFDAPGIIAGCESKVAFGDWLFIPNPDDEFAEEALWYSISNYGVFHCAANIRTASERDELGAGEFSRGFFARIGKGKRNGETWELWVLQQGLLPGSEYLLLARTANPDELVNTFSVLQSRCPNAKLLETDNLDIWNMRYCKLNTRRELVAYAKRMLAEPDYGTIHRIQDEEKGPATEIADPLSKPE